MKRQRGGDLHFREEFSDVARKLNQQSVVSHTIEFLLHGHVQNVTSHVRGQERRALGKF